MKTPEEQWWSIRAGEYVLGTLQGEDLRLFEQILAHDTTIQSYVLEWEKQLAVLNELAPQHTPHSDILPSLLDRIRNLESGIDEGQAHGDNTLTTDSTSIQQPLPSSTVTPIRSTKASRLWPVLASLSTAACLVLGFLLLQQQPSVTQVPFSVDGIAVVLSDEDGSPYFLVETDYGNLRVRVTALSPPSIQASQDFRLWQALPDRSAVRPIALLPEEPGIATIYAVSSLVDGSDLFGVSIEPVGAETTTGPTGPVVAHGDFQATRE